MVQRRNQVNNEARAEVQLVEGRYLDVVLITTEQLRTGHLLDIGYVPGDTLRQRSPEAGAGWPSSWTTTQPAASTPKISLDLQGGVPVSKPTVSSRFTALMGGCGEFLDRSFPPFSRPSTNRPRHLLAGNSRDELMYGSQEPSVSQSPSALAPPTVRNGLPSLSIVVTPVLPWDAQRRSTVQ